MINFFSAAVVRLPMYPYNFFSKINSENFFEEILKDDFFLYQILVSSPGLFKQIHENHQKTLYHSILKYFSRTCNRCTPFGVFSGNLPIKTQSNNYSSVAEIENGYEEIIRFDSSLIYRFLESLDDSLIDNYNYFSNTSAYQIGNEIRYIEYYVNESGYREYKLSAISRNPILKEVIKLGRSAKKIAEYVQLITTKFNNYSDEEIQSYLYELIESKFLINEMDYISIGSVTTEQMLSDFFHKNSNSNQYQFIENILKKTQQVGNEEEPNQKLSDYYDLICALEKRVASKTYFHHDVFFKTKDTFSLNKTQRRILQKGYDILQILKDPDVTINNRLESFLKVFYDRYENNPVALTEVLDVENGIGYGLLLKSNNIGRNPLIDGLYINAKQNEDNSTIRWNKKDAFFIEKIKSSHGNLIKLDQADLNSFHNNTDEINFKNVPTSTLKCSIYKDEYKDIIHIVSINGSAAKVLGRFTNNNDIKNLAKEITDYEQDFFEDHILAEIIHVPENRIGNIVQRDIRRKAEIPYLSNPTDNTSVFINDLYVQYMNGKLVIYDKVSKKRVIPIFSNAFNSQYPSNLPVIDFLLDIQDQYNIKNNAYLNIEKYLKFYNHIPRIQYGNDLILSLEMWKLSLEDYKNHNSIEDYIKILKIPRFFYITDGDNSLMIDFHNAGMREIFIQELEKKKDLIITESLDHSFSSYFENNDLKGSYCNELIVPIKIDSKESKDPIETFKISAVKKTFLPNSEWLYYKIFVAKNFSSELLIKLIPICERLKKKKKIKSFFYIKYYSPDFHVRLRVNVAPNGYDEVYRVINPILNTYVNKKSIYKVQMDTYFREVARYGYEKISFFEDLFYKDSILSQRILKNTINDENSLWKYTVATVLGYSKIFGFSTSDLLNFSTQMHASLAAEFYQNTVTNKSLNLKYKTLCSDILEIIIDSDNFYSQFFNKNFKTLDVNILEFINRLSFNERKYYLNSMIHMHIIRVVNSQNRFYEMLIHYLLKKALKSLAVRNKTVL